MRFERALLAVGSCALAAACSGSNPLSPTTAAIAGGAAPQAPAAIAARNSILRVDEGGSGGGGQCGFLPPGKACGVMTLKAGDVDFHNDSGIPITLTPDPLEFSADGDLAESMGHEGRSDNISPGGHFPTAHIEMTVANGSASVKVTLEGLNNQRPFVASGVAPAVQVLQACGSGFAASVRTEVTLQLLYLGRSQIVEKHPRNCGP